MIVEHVDEPAKPPCRIAHVRGQARHVGHDDDRKPAGELQIVDLRSRTLAKRRKAEPHDAAGTPLRLQAARFDGQTRILVRAGSHALEQRGQLRVQRTPVRGINRYGRASQGVRLMNLKDDDTVSAVALVAESAADEVDEAAMPGPETPPPDPAANGSASSE